MSNPIVLALATQRLTKLVVEDEITKPVRQKIDSWTGDAPEGSLKERINFAVNCGACTSVWAAAAVLLAEQFRPGRLLIRVLAGSSAALIVSSYQDKMERA